MKKKLFISFLVLFLTQNLRAAPTDLEVKFGPRPMDGVYIDALQSFSNPRTKNFGFSFGIWPIQPYFNGFSLGTNYSHYFSKSNAWEVINLSYLYSVQTGLTAELADRYSVNPKVIQKADLILTSNWKVNIAYGKFLFMENIIRYFRSSFILGTGLATSNFGSNLVLCLGWQFETFINDKASWTFDIRENYAFSSDHPHNLAFLFGTSYGF